VAEELRPERDTPVLLSEEGVASVQAELRARGLDGWLLYEFHGANPVAARLLGLGHTTRRGFVLVPDQGRPVALVHAIEVSAWRRWPFERRTYSGWQELEEALARLVRGRGRLAMEVSPRGAVPTLDLVPGGALQQVRDLGVEVVSSGDLVTRFHSVWTAKGRAQHRRAAEVVARIANEAFRRAAAAVREGAPSTEGHLAAWIRSALRAEGLASEVDCIVAAGAHAADPHYAPRGGGDPIGRDALVLIDLWGAFEGGIPADQTWMGYLGRTPDPRVSETWSVVRDARDAAVAFLRDRWDRGERTQGYEVDDVARAVVRQRGYGDHFVHRTGHSIDRSLHGSGPNLDNLESHDHRVLSPGVGFSIEPGIYIEGVLGVRSEINVHLGETGPEVTPEHPQNELLLVPVD